MSTFDPNKKEKSRPDLTLILMVLFILGGIYFMFFDDSDKHADDSAMYESILKESEEEAEEYWEQQYNDYEYEHLSSNSITYEDAEEYLYTEKMIEGPVADITYSSDSYGSPTFIDLGEAYPSEDRFTVVIWEEHLSDVQSVLNDIEINDLIFVEGYIDMYDGIPQIEVTDPEQITVWK